MGDIRKIFIPNFVRISFSNAATTLNMSDARFCTSFIPTKFFAGTIVVKRVYR